MSGSQKQLKGGHQARVHSDQMVLVMATLRLDRITVDKRHSKQNYISGGLQGSSPLDQMLLAVVRQVGRTALTVARNPNESKKTTLGRQGTYT